ncbi:hypothetical protein DL768_006571 [Monosporascus sp. mg162]|nr:hypothetical protein DL768_006571 [Monosporascus sp. mg162]
MGTLDLAQIGRIQAELAELETPDAPLLTSKELQYFWDRGNKRRPLLPDRADNTKPKNMKKKIKEFDKESDAYTDVDDDSDEEAVYKVLCWEDIDLWILRDPLGDGSRDCLAMQILLRFHNNHNKEMVPTWYPFVEEKLPVLCPLTHVLAKALAEGVIDKSSYDTQAEPFFATKLGICAMHIPWKKEFWHKPVFRRTVETFEGPQKSDNPLEGEWLALETALQAKYGKSTTATGADRKMRDRKQNELRTARQTQRRKVAAILRRNYFKTRNSEELDRQLRGIHGPQQPLQKVIFSLPERRRLADILSDLDEDFPEDEIVSRKVDAINAFVSYAWKIEPKENDGDSQQPQTAVSAAIEKPPEAPHAVAGRGRTIAPRPWYVSMIQDTVTTPTSVAPGVSEVQTPPPPYTAVANSHPVHADVPRGGETTLTPRPRQLAKTQHECMFCGRRFTRKGTMWDYVERHLKRRKTDAVPCPRRECKARGLVLNDERHFKNHAKVNHNIDLKPKIVIRVKSETNCPEGRSIHAPSPRPRIVIVSGGSLPAAGKQQGSLRVQDAG